MFDMPKASDSLLGQVRELSDVSLRLPPDP